MILVRIISVLHICLSMALANMTLITQWIRDEPCDDVTFHVMSLMQRYFSTQEVITFVTDNIETVKYDVDVYECIISRLGMPIFKYVNVQEFQQRQPVQDSNFLETPKTTWCFAVVAGSFKEMLADLEVFATVNPQAKYIFIITSGSDIEGGEAVLKIAWNTHKMSRIMLLIPMVDGPVHNLNILVYNPFMFTGEGESKLRGKFFKFAINGSNYVDTGNELVDLMDNQYVNLYAYPVRVYMYEWPSFAKAVRNPTNPREILRFQLLDGEILNLMAKRINFSTKFIGNVKQNTMVGSVRAVDGGTADIATNSRIIADHGVNNTVFLTPLYLVTLKYILPKQYSTKILNVFVYSMFDWDSEVTMIGIFIALILVWYILNYLYENFSKQSQANSIPRALIVVTSSQYFISIKFTKYLRGHQQVLLGSMLIYSVIVSSNFQSSIVKQLANNVEDRDISTLRELVESSFDIRYVSTVHDFVKTAPNTSTTSTVYKLYRKQKRMYSTLDESVKLVAYNKTLAILCTMLVAEEMRSTHLNPSNGRPLIHILEEKLAEFYNSFLVQKSSPYRLRMNQILRRASEGGIIMYEQNKIERQTELNYVRGMKLYRINLATYKRGRSVSIEQIKGLFLVWSYMLTIASFVFCVELSVFYLYPQYQNYVDGKFELESRK